MKLNPLALFVFLCGGITLSIAIYAWRRRSIPGAHAFSIFMVLMSVYILGYSMELASQTLELMLFWGKIEYIGIGFFPTVCLIFAAQYSGQDKWLTKQNLIFILVLPTLIFLARLFNDDLHLIYSTAAMDTSGIIPQLSFTRGPLYLVSILYNLLMVLAASFLLLKKWQFGSFLYRKQAALLISAIFVGISVHVLYLFGIKLVPSLPYLDLNPFSYMILGMAVGVAIFRYRLFELVPVARDALIERLSDGVILLDTSYRLVDANPAARKIFGWSKPPVGENVDALMPSWVTQAFLETISQVKKIQTRLIQGDQTFHYEVAISVLFDKHNHKIGDLMVIHDITDRVQIENQLHELSLSDELTGLNNRRGFKVLAGQLINMANRMDVNAVLIYVDLDRLKWINDTFGHSAGDQALMDTGTILKNAFRSSDIIARFGGDEFVVLALESQENTHEMMLTRLDDRLNAWNSEAKRNFNLSFSVGLAESKRDAPVSIETLLEEADQAMYAIKATKKE
jgi:diguanylate cyclase (GGDEF)-like protein/PAS domain S-box-containing protein